MNTEKKRTSILDIFRRRTRAPAADEAFYNFMIADPDMKYPVGYKGLTDCPEVETAVMRLCQLVSTLPIRLKRNTDEGDERERTALERLVDIEPTGGMYPRQTWIASIVRDMLLRGNAFVRPITKGGYITELRKLPFSSVEMIDGAYDYSLRIDDVKADRENVLNFPYNPDPAKPWRGRGLIVLPEVTRSLLQSRATANGMRENPTPSIIVKINGLTEELQSDEGRDKIERRFLRRKKAGQPWIVPGEAIDVKEIKPCSIKDLAIPESMTLDTRLAAAVVGITPYMLGVGQFDRAAYNNVITATLPPITQVIEQVLTAGLLLRDDLHYVMDYTKLISYDVDRIRDFMYDGLDRGAFNRNEVRAVLGYEPIPGGDEYVALENYIPSDKAGNQKKLKGGGESD